MSRNESFSDLSNDDYPIIQEVSDEETVGDLETLIHTLQYKIENNDPYIKCIKYPNLLISSLIELNYLVGMERLKVSIALQVMRLIVGLNNGEKSTKMLNTILYGPPGVGKTKVGIILAKIWWALGYLNNPRSLQPGQTPNINPIGVNTGIIETTPSFNPLISIVLIFIVYIFAYIASGVSYLYNKVGLMWLLFIMAIVIVVILIFYTNKKTYTYFSSIIPTQQTGEIKIDDTNPRSVKDRDIITVVSRQDFVAEYVGQTATKTKALLFANMGKVIFIDEAYSLINGDRDPFGMEALTTLNLFMSEYPDSVAIIFAGYKDLLKEGIFRYQPGLVRRCMWHFECTGYTGTQLFEIFLRQIYNDNWAIKKSDYEPIKKLICDNKHMFPSFGGDTERLLFFAQLEASRTQMLNNSNSNTNSHTNNSSFSSSSNDNYNTNSYSKSPFQHTRSNIKIKKCSCSGSCDNSGGCSDTDCSNTSCNSVCNTNCSSSSNCSSTNCSSSSKSSNCSSSSKSSNCSSSSSGSSSSSSSKGSNCSSSSSGSNSHKCSELSDSCDRCNSRNSKNTCNSGNIDSYENKIKIPFNCDNIRNRILTYQNVQYGLRRLKENNITDN
jgi:uncharacterized membrane protein YgcG